MRFYNGSRASNSRSEAADRLVRTYISNINKTRRASADYGGSTGGMKSIDGGAGLKQIQSRQARQSDLRQIFKEEGSGRYGARKESFIGRMTDPGSEEREVAIRKQKGMSDDDEFTTT